MKTIKKRKSLGAIALALAVVFLLAQALLYVPAWVQDGIKSYAGASELTEFTQQINVTNGNFDSRSGSGSIRTPSSWTVIEDDASESLVKAGVIDVSTTNFEKNKEDYGLTINPEKQTNSPDNYILMINSEDDTTSYGYKSSTISLEADSYYAISFSALTQLKNSSGFSAYLSGLDIEKSALNSFVCIQSSAWNTYTFFVKTGLSSVDVNLELWLGTNTKFQNASGAVFFDNVKATRYTETAYETAYKGTTAKEISLEQENLDKIANSSFEDGATGWTRTTANSPSNAVSGITSLSANGFSTETTKIDTAPSTNMRNAYESVGGTFTSARNQFGLFMNNIVETATSYASDVFTVDRFEILAVSVWVKTGALSENGASIKLVEDVADDKTPTYSSEFTNVTTNSYTNVFTNNWAQYTFYVKGNPFKSVDLKLVLSLGTSDAETRGYAFFDEIRTTALTVNQYANASTGTYLKTLSLASLDSLDIANGAFNLTADGEKIDGVYAPSDWTLSDDSTVDGKYSGIINTKSEYFDANKVNYGGVKNPGLINGNYNGLDVSQVSNNILMIYNPTLGHQTFTSSEYSVPADGTYKITFYAQVSTGTTCAEVKVLNGTTTIGEFVVTSNEWTKYTVYIKNGANANNVSFALSLGSEDRPLTGHAFFDNFVSESTEDDVYTIENSKTTIACDLADENFLVAGDYTNGVAKPYRYTGANNSIEDASIVAGIMSASENELGLDLVSEDAKSDNRLVIHSPNDTYYSFTSNYSYTFKASSYYVVSVTLKTLGLAQDENNKTLDSDKNAIKYGAFIELAGLNAKSAALDTDEKYITYKFYIKTADAETTSNITISLGASNALTRGSVAVSNIAMVESTEDEYKESVDKLDGAVASAVDLTNGAEDEKDDDSTASRPQLELVDIAGIVIVVALLIAIIGTIVRQTIRKRRNNKTVKVTNSYDRNGGAAGKSQAQVESRLNEVKEEIKRLDSVISALTNAQNDLLAKREATTDTIESEKLLKQLDKVSRELDYELDNMNSVKKERDLLTSMLKNE